MASDKELRHWIEDQLHGLLGFSDRTIADFILAKAKVAKSAGALLASLAAVDVPANDGTRAFSADLLSRLPASRSGPSAYQQQQRQAAALQRKNRGYDMLGEPPAPLFRGAPGCLLLPLNPAHAACKVCQVRAWRLALQGMGSSRRQVPLWHDPPPPSPRAWLALPADDEEDYQPAPQPPARPPSPPPAAASGAGKEERARSGRHIRRTGAGRSRWPAALRLAAAPLPCRASRW
jgi:pre-mRNA-splicing factor ATP-dependent RNA helicase DHX16